MMSKKRFDLSDKDSMYFINGSSYNCPFCNRRSLRYFIKENGNFHYSNNKITYFYLIECGDDECGKISFHLSNYNLKINWPNPHSYDRRGTFFDPPQELKKEKRGTADVMDSYRINNSDGSPKNFDELFFYHQPTSFFVLDERIPRKIREPLSESDNCRINNFLTGASGCLRKAIYILLKHENISLKDGERFLSYHERIDELKKKHPSISSILFDYLKAIQGLTSQELHENDWEDFSNAHLHLLTEATKEILVEIYVTPEELKQRQEKIFCLYKEAKPEKATSLVK